MTGAKGTLDGRQVLQNLRDRMKVADDETYPYFATVTHVVGNNVRVSTTGASGSGKEVSRAKGPAVANGTRGIIVPTKGGGQFFIPAGGTTSTMPYFVDAFGAGPGKTAVENTAAFQAAANALIAAGGVGYLYFDGVYNLSDTIAFYSASALTGLEIRGSGRGSSLVMTADNKPHFSLEAAGGDIHTIHVSGFHATWSTPADPLKTARNVIVTKGSGNFYNSEVIRVRMSKGHYLLNSISTVICWGIDFEGTYQTECSGGFWKCPGTAGKPNMRIQSCYIGAQTMIGPIFDGVGINAELDAVEINQALLSPVIIQDEGGGNYVVGLMGCEGGVWQVDGRRLFNLGNSTLWGEHIFVSGQSKDNTFIFRTEGRGKIEVEFFIMGMTAVGSSPVGRIYCASAGGTNITNPNADRGEIRFGKIRGFNGLVPWTASGNVIALCDVGGSDTADAVWVEEWDEGFSGRPASNTTFGPGDSKLNVVTASGASDWDFTLPDGMLLHSGRSFVIVKRSTGAGALNIRKHGTALLATLPAAQRVRIELVYNRGVQNGPGYDTWTIVDYVVLP